MVVQSNDKFPIFINLTDNGEVVDLTNATVVLKLKKGSTSISKNCTIIDAANGECKAELTATDLDTGKINYSYQVTITYTDGRVISTQASAFMVYPKI